MAAAKNSKGKQKIEMKFIEQESKRLVTFSKRKSGIFKKANDLSATCGADFGILMFSGSGKPFSFAKPSMESIADRFLKENPLVEDLPLEGIENFGTGFDPHFFEAHQLERVEVLKKRYNEVVSQLEAEKEKEKLLKKILMEEESSLPKGWWETPIENLDLQEVQEMSESIEKLDLMLRNHLKLRGNANNSFGASSSSFPKETSDQEIGSD
ncbi:hypothetical protein UlMin_036592 [Ulmus minor]